MSEGDDTEQARLPTGSGDGSSGDRSGASGGDDAGERDGERPAPLAADAPDEPQLPETREERVAVGVDLLASLEDGELSLADAIDRIETVTTNPALTRTILDEAEKRGVIEREDARLWTDSGGTHVNFERQVVKRKGDYECRRCGASVTTGHFIRFDSGELGPFGSSCIRKVTGREEGGRTAERGGISDRGGVLR